MQRALATGFPGDLPLLLFVAVQNKKTPEWLELHHRQAASFAKGTVVPLPGEHYLHTRMRGRSLMGLGTGRRDGGREDALAFEDKRTTAVLTPFWVVVGLLGFMKRGTRL